mmetsp:Transcript_22326/g.35043  ORF Transcript_22326/g.35043 Transcript_22326/m.35043 type:complete len:93 (+) Transcript_22326:275-553(+)
MMMQQPLVGKEEKYYKGIWWLGCHASRINGDKIIVHHATMPLMFYSCKASTSYMEIIANDSPTGNKKREIILPLGAVTAAPPPGSSFINEKI